MIRIPEFADIQIAHQRIKGQVHRTPIFHSTLVDDMLGAELYFKCENLQKAGAFKYRGASNSLLSLSKEELMRGVGTHSSGNHAGALARSANRLGIKAHIVMPVNSKQVKKDAVEGYGAQVRYCEPTLEARESTMEEVIRETGCTFIHPYNRFEIIAGQGTAALELLEEMPDLQIVMAPVGGGGLISGTAIAAKGINQHIQVWGGEPSSADDAYRSMQAKKIIPSIDPKTLADGLLTSLGPLTFTAMERYLDDILLAGESGIVRAMQLVWERMKLIIEPSSAVPLAALMQNPGKWEGRKIGIIVSGGNVDLKDLPF